MAGGGDVQCSRPHVREIKSVGGAPRCARASIVCRLLVIIHMHTTAMCHYLFQTDMLLLRNSIT